MTLHVIDASAILKTVLDEPLASEFQDWFGAKLAAGSRFIAPSVLPYEMARALWKRVSTPPKGAPEWTRDIIRDALIHVELDADAWARLDPWRGRVTAYDAAYLALAAARDATLVTYDDRLAAVARRWVRVESPGNGLPEAATTQPF